jgi:hypothetical protein
MKRIIFISMLFSVLAISCGKEQESRPVRVTHENFIVYYDSPMAMHSTFWAENGNLFDPEEMYTADEFSIAFGSDKQGMSDVEYQITNIIYKNGGYPEKDRVFDSIARVNGDVDYNGASQFLFLTTHRRLKDMEVTSDADYDAAHPAGASLNDILTIEFRAADDFIANGFSYVATGYRPEEGTFLEPLDLFVGKQRRLLAFHFKVAFEKGPDRPDDHRFTITYTNEDDLTLSTTTDRIRIGK